MKNADTFEYIGNLHIHSVFSDGAGTIPQIAQAARKAPVDFFIVNDHDFMTEELHLNWEGFYGNVLALMALEIGKRYNHYLAFDLNEKLDSGGLDAQTIIDSVRQHGGFGFLAHPFEKGMPFSENSRAYVWKDLSVDGYTGICIWNFSSRWKERVRSPIHGLFFLLFKSGTLKGPSSETLSFWDQACLKRRVAAIGGSDAHGSLFTWGILRFKPLSYKYLMKTINVHILLERALSNRLQEAKGQIYTALREGNLFICHENLASAKGFRFGYETNSGKRIIMGQETGFEKGRFEVKLPRKAKIRLIRNGVINKKRHAQQVSWEITKRGVYRLEGFLYMFPFGWRPWIFSNPIYLR
jgi:hypothetical protein